MCGLLRAVLINGARSDPAGFKSSRIAQFRMNCCSVRSLCARYVVGCVKAVPRMYGYRTCKRKLGLHTCALGHYLNSHHQQACVSVVHLTYLESDLLIRRHALSPPCAPHPSPTMQARRGLSSPAAAPAQALARSAGRRRGRCSRRPAPGAPIHQSIHQSINQRKQAWF